MRKVGICYKNCMKRWLRRFLKLTPFVIGLAHVAGGLEAKQKRRFSFKRIVLGVMLLSVMMVLASMVYVKAHYDSQFKGQTDGCAVVFGAAVWKGDQPSNALNDRTQAAIDLYKNRQVNCLIFSGGASKYGAHEVAVMGRLAREAGVPERRISYDYEGNNTLATMLNLPKDKPLVMVSNDFHMARIKLMAKRLGIDEFYLHAAPYEYGHYNKNTQYYWREVAGTLIIWFGL